MPGQSAHLPEAFVNIARSAGGSAAGAIPIVITNTPISEIILECVLIFSSVFCLIWELGVGFLADRHHTTDCLRMQCSGGDGAVGLGYWQMVCLGRPWARRRGCFAHPVHAEERLSSELQRNKKADPSLRSG